jgi:type VI secretion system secreted protein Hcp
MAFTRYVAFKGTKQGTFHGGSTRHQDWTEVISFSFGEKVPLDTGTGQATGRRQHNPIVIVKESDQASPQLYQASVTNETLKSAVLSFARPNASGKEEVYQTIELTNGAIVKYRTFAGQEEVTVNFENSSANSGAYRRLQHEIFFDRLV